MRLVGEAHLWFFRRADSTARENVVAFGIIKSPSP